MNWTIFCRCQMKSQMIRLAKFLVIQNFIYTKFNYIKNHFQKYTKENSNVLHVHSNNDLIKTSKIENHIRENIKNDFDSNANAFNGVQLNLVNKKNI